MMRWAGNIARKEKIKMHKEVWSENLK